MAWYAQHVPDGETYAVEAEGNPPNEVILGVCGPLYYREVERQSPMDYEFDTEDNEWAQEELAQGRLVILTNES